MNRIKKEKTAKQKFFPFLTPGTKIAFKKGTPYTDREYFEVSHLETFQEDHVLVVIKDPAIPFPGVIFDRYDISYIDSIVEYVPGVLKLDMDKDRVTLFNDGKGTNDIGNKKGNPVRYLNYLENIPKNMLTFYMLNCIQDDLEKHGLVRWLCDEEFRCVLLTTKKKLKSHLRRNQNRYLAKSKNYTGPGFTNTEYLQ